MAYKIKFSVTTKKQGCAITEERDLKDTYNISDEEWDAMSPEDKTTFLNEEYQEWLNNNVDGSAYVE